MICIMSVSCIGLSSSLATTVSAVEGCGDLEEATPPPRPLGMTPLHPLCVCPSGKLSEGEVRNETLNNAWGTLFAVFMFLR